MPALLEGGWFSVVLAAGAAGSLDWGETVGGRAGASGMVAGEGCAEVGVWSSSSTSTWSIGGVGEGVLVVEFALEVMTFFLLVIVITITHVAKPQVFR